MKKIFTLVFATAMLSTAFAQYGQKSQHNQDNDRNDYAYIDHMDYGKPGKGHFGPYVFTPRDRDMQIAQINREYDFKVNRVKQQVFVSWFQKKRQISALEDQRSFEIKAVWAKFTDRRNKFGDHGRKNGHW